MASVVVLGGSLGGCGSEPASGGGGGGAAAGSGGMGIGASAGTSAGMPDEPDGGSPVAGASGEGGSFAGASDSGGAAGEGGAARECSSAADCDEGEHCRGTECRPLVVCRADEDCPNAAAHCDLRSFRCEECGQHSDCGPGGECTAGQVCLVHPTCSPAQPCPNGLVCDQLNRCVECVYSADCGGERKCLAGRCADGCTSDAQCADTQQCDSGFAACVECLDDAECPATQHCNYGRCELDTCVEHERFCYPDGLYECAENGATHVKLNSCPLGCGLHDDGIGCHVCQPGAVACSQDNVVTCSEDGGAWVTSQNCPQENEFCQAGQCLPRLCTPNEDSCVSRDLYHCNENGSALVLAADCYHGEVCDPVELACVPQLCEYNPNRSTCSGNQAVLCDETGLAFTAPPDDCGTKICSLGACLTNCTTTLPYEGIRLYEVSAGKVVLKNISGCPLDIVGLSFEIWVAGAVTSKAIWRLPALTLQPQSVSTIVDAAAAGDVELTGFATALNSAPDKSIWLCIDPDGSAGNNTLSICSDETIIDFVEFGDAAPPFDGFAWEGLLEPNLSAGDLVSREVYTGSEPTFKASDWSVHGE